MTPAMHRLSSMPIATSAILRIREYSMVGAKGGNVVVGCDGISYFFEEKEIACFLSRD
jgi:hypothetical protein